MTEERRSKLREAFKRYHETDNTTKKCKDPCLSNGKSDRYCLECANFMIEPILKP